MKNMRLEEMNGAENLKTWVRLWGEYKSTIIRLEDIKIDGDLECEKCKEYHFTDSKYIPRRQFSVESFIKAEKDCRKPNSEIVVLVLIKSKFPFCERCPYKANAKRTMYAVYSLTESKFILPFEEYGALSIGDPFIVAYRNEMMGAFTYGGETIIPMTPNIAITFITTTSIESRHPYYLKIAKLPENWLEKGKEKKELLRDKKRLEPTEEYSVLRTYFEERKVKVGVYSVLQNRLIVPIKYFDVELKKQREHQDKKYGEIYIITDDGLFSDGIYSKEGKCLLETGKYGTVIVTKKYIVARKRMRIGGYNSYITTEEALGPNCGQVTTYEYLHDGKFKCTSCVDIYSHEGKLLKENVFIATSTSDIGLLTSLEEACINSKIDKKEF